MDWKRPPEEVLHHEQADPQLVRRHAEEGRAEAAKSATGVAFEPLDVHPPAVVRLGLVVVVTTLLAVFASFGLFSLLRSREARSDPPRPPLAIREGGRVPPEPRLQTTPAFDLAATREQQRDLVDQYGWEDKDAGRVRIPIEEAMKLYVERQRQRPPTTPLTEAVEPTDASAPYPPGGARAAAAEELPAPAPSSSAAPPKEGHH